MTQMMRDHIIAVQENLHVSSSSKCIISGDRHPAAGAGLGAGAEAGVVEGKRGVSQGDFHHTCLKKNLAN